MSSNNIHPSNNDKTDDNSHKKVVPTVNLVTAKSLVTCDKETKGIKKASIRDPREAPLLINVTYT